jgi:hypothetical protein
MKILVLSVHDSDSLIQSILKVRASGYLLKSDATRDLVTAKGHGHYRVDHIRMTAGQLLNQFLTEAKRILE